MSRFVFVAVIFLPMAFGISALWLTTPQWRAEGPVFAAVIFTLVAVMLGFLVFLLIGPKPKLVVTDREIRFSGVRKSKAFTLYPNTTVAVIEGYERLTPIQALVISLTSRIRHGGNRWLLIPTQTVGTGKGRKPSASGLAPNQSATLEQIHSSIPELAYHKIPLGAFDDAAEGDLVQTLASWGKPMLFRTR